MNLGGIYMKCRYCKGDMIVTEQQVHECPQCGVKCIETYKK